MPPQQDYQRHRSRLNIQIYNGLLCVFKLQATYMNDTTCVKYNRSITMIVNKIYTAFYEQKSGSNLCITSGEFKSGKACSQDHGRVANIASIYHNT